jgi:amino acid permease
VYVAVMLVLFAMSLSIFSLNIICQLSEKYGCATYSEVMEKTLGRRAKQAATYCLVVILFLVIIAYLILLRDVASELFEYFTPDNYEVTVLMKNMILTTLAVLAYPMMTADSLHALRHASLLGATCILMLLGCLCLKAYQHHQEQAEAGLSVPLKYTPTSITDVLTALPITFIGFLCHFNVNGVFCDLSSPQDIKCVVRSTVSGTAVVFLLFGFAGYVFAGADTADNVLKNISSRDPLLMFARVGLSITLMSQLPIMVIPCRKTVYPLLWPETNQVAVTQRRRAESHDVLVRRMSSPHDKEVMLRDRGRATSFTHHPLDYFSSPAAPSTRPQVVEVEQGFGVQLDASTVRYGLTLLILALTLMVSQSLPGVSVVWTVAGSTLTIIICYLLPAAAYLAAWRQLGPERELCADVVGCYAMFGVGILFMLVCTPQALHNAFAS